MFARFKRYCIHRSTAVVLAKHKTYANLSQEKNLRRERKDCHEAPPPAEELLVIYLKRKFF